jgi:WD40 repeat protein
MKDLVGDKSQCRGVRAINLHPTKPLMLIGTLGSEIFEIEYTPPGFNFGGSTSFKVKGNKAVMNGHYCPNLKWTNEVWGLDVFKKKDSNRFATCSDDGTLRVWDYIKRR